MGKSSVSDRNKMFGLKLKRAIVTSGLTQVEFAEKMGLTPSRLSNYVTGTRLPDFFTICDICRCLGVPMETFDPYAITVDNDKSNNKYMLTVHNSGGVTLSKIA
jgi:transcriptional regulator with XRE-family HTH domain